MGRSIRWSKNTLFNKWCWETWTATCKKKKETQPPTYTMHKNKLKSQHHKSPTGEHKQENLRYSTQQYMSPGARDIKERINKWDLIKIKLLHG